MSRRLVALAELAPGDVLGQDLRDAAGSLLLAAGTVLGTAAIECLRRHAVTAVVVDAPAGGGEQAERGDPDRHAAARSIVERELQARFRHAGAGEATRLLFAATLEFLVEKRI